MLGVDRERPHASEADQFGWIVYMQTELHGKVTIEEFAHVGAVAQLIATLPQLVQRLTLSLETNACILADIPKFDAGADHPACADILNPEQFYVTDALGMVDDLEVWHRIQVVVALM